MSNERHICSHDECPEEMPSGTKIPEGWTVAIVEEYKKTSVVVYNLHLCPNHKLNSVPKQTTLFGDAA